ncbi:bifunctional dTDP-4-dehydrorhamnose 3,5-epimerase family protein/NAD(P)-dependent oxidoreductase [Actinomyces vulturis]|uniref:sugar nucleotide-binding protein n=1 Tax=Actinomyces vulturis TaxID=1857645 RepID=UPI00082DB666
MTANPLAVRSTPIPGVLVIDLTVHGDNRGWFKENWQREKMLELGLPDFGPVQNNISFNDEVGVTRGIHAEPWDKYVSVATGRVFGAWVDLREGETFGTVFTHEIGPDTAVFVPAGVGNSYQTLEPQTAYTYLVNDHWSPEAQYTFLNLADETVAITWPIPLDQAILSDKDRAHPRLGSVIPFVSIDDADSCCGEQCHCSDQTHDEEGPTRVLVTGANGQLGRELMRQLPAAGFEAIGVDLPDVNIADMNTLAEIDWSAIDVVINAAAWTNVDGAETSEGRPQSWMANAVGPANLSRICSLFGILLIHVSSEYTFDGTQSPHREDEAPSPLGVYGQSKVGGDTAVSACPFHYIVRTSWVVGDGKNFVKTMAQLADKGVEPSVVADQVGRLTFTTDLAAGIIHLINCEEAEFGTYNLSNEGPEMSWADVARRVFELRGKNADSVTSITTDEYFAGKDVAPRPLKSLLDLSKIESTGFIPATAEERLVEYVASLA